MGEPKQELLEEYRTSSEAYWSAALRARLASIANAPSGLASHALGQADFISCEERVIAAVLQDVRTHLNDVRPVARLPPEILSHIFRIYSRIAPPFYVRRFEPSPRLEWIRVTHVCRRWRHVALAHTSLWTRVPLSLGTDWAHTFLHRSKPSSLHFGVPFGPSEPWSSHAVTIIQQNIHRTKSLCLNWGNVESSESSLLRKLENPAPILEDLEYQDGSRDLSLPAFPTNFLGGFAPRLRSVNIWGKLRISWSSPIFRNLVSLKLHTTYIDDETPSPLLHEVLDALERMSVLKSLDLQHKLPRADIPLAVDRIVHLPRLAFIRLHDSAQKCTSLIRHLKIPTDATVDLYVGIYFRETSTDLKPFFPAILACLGVTTTIPIATLSVKAVSSTLTLQGWREAADCAVLNTSMSRPRARPDFKLTFGGFMDHYVNGVDTWDRLGVRRFILNTFASGDLRKVWMTDKNWTMLRWKELSQRAPGVVAILPEDRAGQELCRALGEDRDTDILFPRLASLWLDGSESDLSRVIPKDVLAAREEAGCTLKVLMTNSDDR
ncbi:hypothetical protein FA95DRAFT_1678993 [Auriscalpium vulgare]|uniref:Uncharacterized protein n=1 Tax=Auriscalpium vulgare TaxID=40419 RepID=A0ACB8RUT5_9AGAM|nr:hypothetical protein FA95DRAFT_1678993 [Auriscalpium vulgare]